MKYFKVVLVFLLMFMFNVEVIKAEDICLNLEGYIDQVLIDNDYDDITSYSIIYAELDNKGCIDKLGDAFDYVDVQVDKYDQVKIRVNQSKSYNYSKKEMYEDLVDNGLVVDENDTVMNYVIKDVVFNLLALNRFDSLMSSNKYNLKHVLSLMSDYGFSDSEREYVLSNIDLLDYSEKFIDALLLDPLYANDSNAAYGSYLLAAGYESDIVTEILNLFDLDYSENAYITGLEYIKNYDYFDGCLLKDRLINQDLFTESESLYALNKLGLECKVVDNEDNDNSDTNNNGDLNNPTVNKSVNTAVSNNYKFYILMLVFNLVFVLRNKKR